ncbi:Glucose-methanol-choline oxidoreductase [Cordyceps fumosorosea ARSEF 2679]|uniref:Glucose-methanol-choline oxidoreductase n=1 Tax=Cordyceps fumosorosea (strain ARSEF 2679) TaxID=1081104 RepID=A0A167TPU9_CORFA|nr:Glucose-methanol-choline oxidoreductase [Cordyceps fumosorosea ARSEF 2679]OAA60822.1 Glucose-methanol-choline oxidoreductase [Cordyceps fumosorosea ARSEF 2679]
MTRKHSNPMTNPLHYATPQLLTGAPATYTTAQRKLLGYDYVIVGGGCAGCVLASKLSEDKDVTVLLLEAGGPHTGILESRVPLLFSKLFHGEHDWDYTTVEQPGLAYRRMYWPRGKLLGGSTSINAMMYHHGSPSDYDEWASDAPRLGCKGWSYADLAPYFRRMENFTANPARPAIDLSHRGTGGEWQTGYSALSPMVEGGFLPACADAGIAASPDINTAAGTLGVTRFQTFIDSRGERSSMATAFLTPEVLRRPNLYVGCRAHVTRVLYDRMDAGKEPCAIGVEFQTKKGGERYEVHARREVILSGGAVNTPQTLLLSGVGPAAELARLGIPVVRDSPAVGRHMKDHLCPTGVSLKTKTAHTYDYLNDNVKAIPALLRWLVTGGGPLSSNVGEAAAFIRSVDHPSKATRPENRPKDYSSGGIGPDVEILGAPIAFIHHGEEPAPPGTGIFTLGPCLLRPQSTGTITLKTNDPFDHPIIDPKYFSDEGDNDRKVMLAAMRLSIKIANSAHWKDFVEPIPRNDDPNYLWWPSSSSDPESITDEQLLTFLKERAFTLYHPVGTARMGPDDSGDSVVDLECRVHGVGRLRVVDASVFPEQISGHPTAAIGAIAYKMSDVIKKTFTPAGPSLANL